MEEQGNPNRFELIYELLNEIENNQITIVSMFQNHHTVTMKKLMKIVLLCYIIIYMNLI